MSLAIGAIGERAAVKWLRQNGYLIRDLNWRNGRYEIDIIAEKLRVIHFFEVKCRKENALTRAEDAITDKKFQSILKAARLYVAQNRITDDCQFDLIAVDVAESGELTIRVIEHAMEFKW